MSLKSSNCICPRKVRFSGQLWAMKLKCAYRTPADINLYIFSCVFCQNMALPGFFLTLSNILSVPEFQLRFWNVFQLGCSSYALNLLLWKKTSLKFDTFAIKIEENQVWLSYIFAWWCFLHVFLRHFNFNQIKVFQAVCY